MKRRLSEILTLFMVLVVQIAFAQEKTVAGKVHRPGKGMPLPGCERFNSKFNKGYTNRF